jgi:hypothetical protein
MAPVISRSGGSKPLKAARPVKDRAAVKARRVMIKVYSRKWRVLKEACSLA